MTRGWGRTLSPSVHAGSNDVAFRRLSQLDRILRGSFQETAPRKIAENTVKFNGSQPPRWRQKFGGRNNTTIFDNIDIGGLLTLIGRCSSRLRCCRFSMSDVYIGQTLMPAPLSSLPPHPRTLSYIPVLFMEQRNPAKYDYTRVTIRWS